MMNLEKRKAAFLTLEANERRNGYQKMCADYIADGTVDSLLFEVQAERDVRRLGLHRIEEAIDDLTKEELKDFVAFLLEQSKLRQLSIEEKFAESLCFVQRASKDTEWLQALKKLNRLAVSNNENCWFCGHQPLVFFRKKIGFAPFMYRAFRWWLFVRGFIKNAPTGLGLKVDAERSRRKDLEEQ